MAQILIGQAELGVSEDAEEVLNRVVSSRDGLRRSNGSIVAPAGWIVLTEADADKPIYVQVGRVGYVYDA
jgi:hypothetical protein